VDAVTRGLQIRRLRIRRRLSKDELASWAGRSVRWIYDLEAGRAPLDAERAERIALGLGVDVEVVLGLAPIPGDVVGDDDDVKRREFLRKAIIGAVTASLVPPVDVLDPEPWERLQRVLARPDRIDSATIAHLDRAVTALESMEYELAPAALIGPVRGQLDELGKLLEGSLPPSARQQLLSLAGETAVTAGWLMWDLQREVDVREYWSIGGRAAQRSGDRALMSFVQVSMSFQYREQPVKRIPILRASERGATPRTRAWALAAQAEAHAVAGDEHGCLAALDRADTVLAKFGDDRSARRPRYDPFDATRMYGERGAALVKLASHGRFRSRGRQARSLLERAITDMRGQPRMVNSLRASLARALAQTGDADGAVRIAFQALDGATAMGTKPTLGALRKVLGDLQPWSDSPVVDQLAERLRAVP
jgi:transcriptional regulator with XRE-family HTH domain